MPPMSIDDYTFTSYECNRISTLGLKVNGYSLEGGSLCQLDILGITACD